MVVPSSSVTGIRGTTTTGPLYISLSVNEMPVGWCVLYLACLIELLANTVRALARRLNLIAAIIALCRHCFADTVGALSRGSCLVILWERARKPNCFAYLLSMTSYLELRRTAVDMSIKRGKARSTTLMGVAPQTPWTPVTWYPQYHHHPSCQLNAGGIVFCSTRSVIAVGASTCV